MQVGVVGTGHVGLVTCVSLAALRHEITGTDQDSEKIEQLRRGVPPFFEPGLDRLLSAGLAAGNLRFTEDPAEAVGGAEVVLICVGTPSRMRGETNLVYVENAARIVARHATGRTLVVDKSTVPAGTASRVRRTFKRERPDLAGELEVASNPEYLREGSAIEDAMNPDRIVVGAESDWAFDMMRRLYEPLIEKGHLLIETSIDTAELSKHACNAFLALKISFVNAMARLCERTEGDVKKVAEVMGADPRIGPHFLEAGLGFGGSCFPKDIVAFERLAHRLGYDLPLLREIARINQEATHATLEKVKDALWNLEDKRIALLGLAFKPRTDDVRESPALALAQQLLNEGATVCGYDPHAQANAKAEIPDLEIAMDAYEAARGAHCAVLCTAWEEFAHLDLARFKEAMAYPVVVDGRNLFDPVEMESHGFSYYPTGRPAVG
jgi:UDPglucose 6-dehydrogenase